MRLIKFLKIFGNKQKCKLKQYSFVKFDKSSCPSEIYHMYFEKTFGDNLYIFLGEVPNCKSHCVLADLKSGKVIGMYHTSNFRVATEDEI
jgi:hypothetical protein